MRSTYQLEYRRRIADAVDRRNQAERDDISRNMGAMGGVVVTPDTAIAEEKLRDNALILLAGTHGGATLTRPNTLIIGQPGAVIERLLVIDAPNEIIRIQSVHFRCMDAKATNAAALVTISALTTVQFVDCTFEKLPPAPTGDFVSIAATGYAHFLSCSFIPANTIVGFVVNNAGAAANVVVVGCSNKTTQAHQNVTDLGSTP